MYAVYRNGKVAFNGFETLEDAKRHATSMEQVSVRLDRYQDRWSARVDERESNNEKEK